MAAKQQQDLINALVPVELLSQVFSYLPFQDQLTLMHTCRRWQDVMETEQFASRRLLRISPTTIGQIKCMPACILEDFCAVSIGDAYEVKQNFIPWFHWLVLERRALEHVRELRLSLTQCSTEELFPAGEELRFPKLERIQLHFTEGCVVSEGWCEKFLAPKLKSVEVDVSEDGDGGFVRRFAEQIEELSIAFEDKESFFMTVGEGGNFDKLASLTMDTKQAAWDLTIDDLTPGHLLMFTQLKYLKIVDWRNVFFYVYEYIFWETRHLERLFVCGVCMNEEAFTAIGNLKKLRELSLLCGLHISNTAKNLALPELRKLTVCQQVVPVVHVPKLRTLVVRSELDVRRGPLKLDAEASAAAHYDVLAQLKTIRIENCSVGTQFIKQLCVLPKLEAVELHNVELRQLNVLKLFAYLRGLRRVQVVNCTLIYEKLVQPPGVVDHGIQLMPNRVDVFFQMLTRQNENVQIANIANSMRTVEKLACVRPPSGSKKAAPKV